MRGQWGQDAHERVQLRIPRRRNVREPMGGVESMLLGPIIGQQHEVPNVRVSLETRLQQPVADSPALTCLGDEDVLEVDDGHVVRQTAREADQSLILARGDDKRRVAHGLDEAVQIARV